MGRAKWRDSTRKEVGKEKGKGAQRGKGNGGGRKGDEGAKDVWEVKEEEEGRGRGQT